MRDEVGGEHAEVVARLDGIDETTRERVRKVVVKSLTVLDSESFDRALARVFDVNPLPLAMLITAAALVLVVVPLVGSAAALASLGSAGGWLTVLGVVTVGLWVLVRLGRLGVAGRTLRALIVAFGVVVGFAGPKVTWSEPGSLRHLAARWLPAAAGLKVNLSIPYPVWLGFSIVVYVAVTVTGALLLVWLLERLSRPAEPRQVPGDSLVAGGRLLHALLDVAYQAQKMVDNPELAASSRERARLHRLVQVAASTASPSVPAMGQGHAHQKSPRRPDHPRPRRCDLRRDQAVGAPGRSGRRSVAHTQHGICYRGDERRTKRLGCAGR